MLIAKIFINNKQIDEIHIHNLGEIKNGVWKYAIEKPDVSDTFIKHIRADGYKRLLMKALKIIQFKDEYEN